MSKQYARRLAKNDPKGDRRSRSFLPEPSPLPASSVETEVRDLAVLDTGAALLALLARGDGWVRATSDLDLKNLYLKYKYTSGTWRGHYVMVVTTPDMLQWGMQLLLYKTHQADSGELRPSKDTPYNYQ